MTEPADVADWAAEAAAPSPDATAEPMDPSRAASTPYTFDVPEGTERAYSTALATGVLGGDEASGCLWLTGNNGEGFAVRLMTDDPDTHADVSVDPFVIRSGTTVLATEGQAIEMGGGLGGDQPYAQGCPVTGGLFMGFLRTP